MGSIDAARETGASRVAGRAGFATGALGGGEATDAEHELGVLRDVVRALDRGRVDVREPEGLRVPASFAW